MKLETLHSFICIIQIIGFNFKSDPIHIEHQQADHEDFPSTPRRTSSTDASFRSQSQPPRTPLIFPRDQSRRQPPPSPRSSHAQPRTQQDMYRSNHGTRVKVPSNDDATVFEPSSMFEVVRVMKGHVDGFARGLNTLMKILDNEDDLMLALDVTDQDGGDFSNKSSMMKVVASLSNSAKAIPLNL